MLFPSNESKELIFEDDFFKESKTIKEAIANYSEPKRARSPKQHYLGGQARVALTFNGGTLYLNGDEVIVKVPCAWPRYSTTGLPKRLSVRWPEISVQEGLFGFSSRNAGSIPILLFGKCLSRHKYLYLARRVSLVTRGTTLAKAPTFQSTIDLLLPLVGLPQASKNTSVRDHIFVNHADLTPALCSRNLSSGILRVEPTYKP